MLEMRPATRDDVAAVSLEPLQRTGKTYAVVSGEKTVAVTGYYFDQGRVVVYSMITPQAKTESTWYARDVFRMASRVVREAAQLGMPVFAGADEEISGANKLLERLGFNHEGKGVYSWHGHH